MLMLVWIMVSELMLMLMLMLMLLLVYVVYAPMHLLVFLRVPPLLHVSKPMFELVFIYGLMLMIR